MDTIPIIDHGRLYFVPDWDAPEYQLPKPEPKEPLQFGPELWSEATRWDYEDIINGFRALLKSKKSPENQARERRNLHNLAKSFLFAKEYDAESDGKYITPSEWSKMINDVRNIAGATA